MMVVVVMAVLLLPWHILFTVRSTCYMISLKYACLLAKAKGYHNENHDDKEKEGDDGNNGDGKTQRPIKNNAHTKI